MRLHVTTFPSLVADFEGLDVIDERPRGETTPMNVRSDGTPIVRRSAPVCFWRMPQHGPHAMRPNEVTANDVRPGDAGFDFDQAAVVIELADAIESPHVEQRRAGQELLAAHRVPPARDRQRSPGVAGVVDGAHDFFDGSRLEDSRHDDAVQRRMRVVHLAAVTTLGETLTRAGGRRSELGSRSGDPGLWLHGAGENTGGDSRDNATPRSSGLRYPRARIDDYAPLEAGETLVREHAGDERLVLVVIQYHDRVSAAQLRFVERFVGELGGASRLACARPARSPPHRRSPKPLRTCAMLGCSMPRSRHRAPHLLGDLPSLRGIDVVQKSGKLFAAIARHDVEGPLDERL